MLFQVMIRLRVFSVSLKAQILPKHIRSLTLTMMKVTEDFMWHPRKWEKRHDRAGPFPAFFAFLNKNFEKIGNPFLSCVYIGERR